MSKREAEKMQANLAIIRKACGWTADDLSKMMDVSRQSISSWETGRTKLNSIGYLAISFCVHTLIEDDIDRGLFESEGDGVYYVHPLQTLLDDIKGDSNEHIERAKQVCEAMQLYRGDRNNPDSIYWMGARFISTGKTD